MAKILVVDDEAMNAALLVRHLNRLGYEVHEARNGLVALEILEREEFDLLLLDVMMPHLDGFEVARRVREHPTRHQETKIIFLTAKSSIDSKLEGLQLGAIDYITKPFDFRELQARIKIILQDVERRKKLEVAAYTDFLTGLSNRRYVKEQLVAALQRVAIRPEPLMLMLLDLDSFKRINDTYGHVQGDVVLVKVAQILRQAVGAEDVVGRYGGEEFLILLVGRTMPEVLAVAESIRDRVAQHPLQLGGTLEAITISIGVSEYGGGALSEWIHSADQALYQAKKTGRNRVVQA
ncbi:GGDEF domain-containing response regulator [Tumebacillus permanentifrigoris]|uniref:Response regulator receiver modulated diguanylate cyclase n=1 Tax=Tumebacillus permanentifrigoris TaxID=378543 RepID=A0A316DBU6_9BACL|nr:diguanylate cyclase [Tumebacillus permanentifrigoris]PWK13504.1 response regulator receiver modulated diguanylate cyclase [Tumebacillus permanentifrigoris]